MWNNLVTYGEWWKNQRESLVGESVVGESVDFWQWGSGGVGIEMQKVSPKIRLNDVRPPLHPLHPFGNGFLETLIAKGCW